MHAPRLPQRAAIALVLTLLISAGIDWSALPAQASPADGDTGSGAPAPESIEPGIQVRTLAAGNRVRWNDVPKGFWASRAINYVGAGHRWMRDYRPDGRGRFPFRPSRLEPRKLFFRSVVRAFAPRAKPSRRIEFADLPKRDRFHRFANILVKLGWIDPAGRRIRPDQPVTMQTVHHVLVMALGLRSSVAGLNRIRTADGRRFHTSGNFGTSLIGMRIGLRINHSNESLDVTPRTPLPRSEVAWSLYRAKTVAPWTLDSMHRYDDIRLPRMRTTKRRIVQWGIRFAGYPYVWGGEWHRPTSGGCCGSQPVGGFDCSGLTWWVMKAAGGGWDNAPPRPYRGWSLPQRSSADMASAGKRIRWRKVRVGDLLFYDGSGDRVVDHVNVYVGNGWALDSSSGAGGVTLMWVGNGWYRDHFHHARRLN